MSTSIAWFVAPFARFSSILPSSTKVMSMAQVSKYGMPSLMAPAWDQSPMATGRNVMTSEKAKAMVVPSATSTSMLAEPERRAPHAPL